MATKSISKTGYLPKTEKISATWNDLGLNSIVESRTLVMSKRDAEFWDKRGARKVKVTLTLILEDLE